MGLWLLRAMPARQGVLLTVAEGDGNPAGVSDPVGDGVNVSVLEAVAVGGVMVIVPVGVGLGVAVGGVPVTVAVGDSVGVGLIVRLGVNVGPAVEVGPGVIVLSGMGVGAQIPA